MLALDSVSRKVRAMAFYRLCEPLASCGRDLLVLLMVISNTVSVFSDLKNNGACEVQIMCIYKENGNRKFEIRVSWKMLLLCP